MRALVLLLALLATLKIWVQDSLYRSATSDALVAAYRTRAVAACTKATLPNGTSAFDWINGPEPRVAVGNPHVQVHVWEIDHELWNARFRQPYLVLAPPGSQASCTYDILADTAEISRS